MSASKSSSTPSTWDPDKARAVIREQKHLPGALLPVLHAVQDTFDHIPPEAVPVVAEELNMSRADVHGVISFYHFFREQPPGKHAVAICRAEACQSMNSDALADHAKKRLGTDFHATSEDGRYSLDPVYCLGNCALAPAAQIDGRLYGRLSAPRLDALVAELEEQSE